MGKAVRRRTVLSVAIAAPMIIGRRASAADRSITVGNGHAQYSAASYGLAHFLLLDCHRPPQTG
ncbi:MAG: hypothetical protein ACLPKW_28725, partial [Acetobacteraceae bacterium]